MYIYTYIYICTCIFIYIHMDKSIIHLYVKTKMKHQQQYASEIVSQRKRILGNCLKNSKIHSMNAAGHIRIGYVTCG